MSEALTPRGWQGHQSCTNCRRCRNAAARASAWPASPHCSYPLVSHGPRCMAKPSSLPSRKRRGETVARCFPMTLIASFEFQHVPVLLGDMLITSPGAPTKESHTPLVHTPNKIIDLKEARYVSSLRQKLAILHDHVCLAWAGDLFHAQRFAEYIRSFASGVVSIDYDELRRTIDAYPREDLEGHLEFVIHAWHGTGWGYFSNLKPFDLDPLRQIRVSGTGKTHFIEHIEHVAKRSIIGNLDAYTELATRALAYASLASAQQFFGGVGLNEWWGGGFEVVVFRDGRLTKLGPICWLYWECAEIAQQHYSLNLKPSFMYQFYVGDTAMFWIDEGLAGC
jgi:hypothetical protein